MTRLYTHALGFVAALALLAAAPTLAMDKIGNCELYGKKGEIPFTPARAGQVDVAMTDTAIVLGQANESKGKQLVVGQYSTGEVYGAIYPKGSANAATIDKIILALEKDGTLKKLDLKYLATAWGKDPTAIPYFKP